MSQSNLEQTVASQLQKWQADPFGKIRAGGFINSLAFRIAEARAAHGNYAVVMTFGEDDYDRPSGRTGIHESECKPEWLKGAAKQVYDYCLSQSGLTTFISGGSAVVDFVPGGLTRVPFMAKYTFDIIVRW